MWLLKKAKSVYLPYDGTVTVFLTNLFLFSSTILCITLWLYFICIFAKKIIGLFQ